MTRAEHLAWARERALAYVERGDLQNAFASLFSDAMKWEGPEPLIDAELAKLAVLLRVGGHLDTPEQMRHWIEGFQ